MEYDGLGEILVPQRYTVHLGENENIIEEWSVCNTLKDLLQKPEFEPYFLKQYRKTKVASLSRHGDLYNSNYELAND